MGQAARQEKADRNQNRGDPIHLKAYPAESRNLVKETRVVLRI